MTKQKQYNWRNANDILNKVSDHENGNLSDAEKKELERQKSFSQKEIKALMESLNLPEVLDLESAKIFLQPLDPTLKQRKRK